MPMPTTLELQLLSKVSDLENKACALETQIGLLQTKMASALQTLSATQTAIAAMQLPSASHYTGPPVHSSP